MDGGYGQRGIRGEQTAGHAYGKHVRCICVMKGWSECAYLPPPVVVPVVSLDDLDGLSDLESYFVFVFGHKVVQRVHILRHG